MTDLLRNLRVAVRMWLHSPVLALAAIGTLALGVGVSTAVFSVASGALFNVAPWDDLDRLHVLDTVKLSQSPDGEAVPSAVFLDWQEQLTSFEGIMANTFAVVSLTDGAESIAVFAPKVTPTSFSLAGVRPLLGRVFTAQDAAVDAEPAVLLSEGLWKRQYGGDPSLVGRTIEVDGGPVRVIGVLSSDQYFPSPDAELVQPLRLERVTASRSERTLFVLGKLKPGVTRAQAQTELDVVAKRLEEQYPGTDAGWTGRVRTIRESFGNPRQRQSIVLLMAAVGFVLLIVCANVANLLLARAASRTKEIATRSAIGASRGQIALQMMLEAAVLGAAALPLGLLVGLGALEYFLTLVPPQLTWIETVLRFDRPVVTFALCTSAGTVLVFGVIPALRASRVDLQRALKEGGGRGASAARPWVRQALAVAQLGLAISLLSTAFLFIQSLNAVQERDPGVDADRLLVTSIMLPSARYAGPAQWRDFERQLVQSLEGGPGMESVGVTNFPPFGYPGERIPFVVDGSATDVKPTALIQTISSSYLRTTGLDQRAGSGFGEEAREGGTPVALVNEMLVKTYFAGESPIGRRIQLNGESREITGVVSDYYNISLRDPIVPQLFVPFAQMPGPGIGLVARAKGDPSVLATQIRDALRRIDSKLAVPGFQVLEQRMISQLWGSRFISSIMQVLSGAALLLAALGVYAVISYSATQQAHSFAIRAALGAEPSWIARLVLRQATGLALFGTLVAFVLSGLLLRPLLTGLLATGQGWDPVGLVGIAFGLTLVSLAAAAEPALRATRNEPIHALRSE